MPDVPIRPGGVQSAPADWTIPLSAEILLKMVFASFDGSGAATSFKPCLRIISDAGSVVGEAVADDTVAAGGSADVTWFPHLAAGGGAAATTNAEWFFARRTTSLTMGAGAQDTIPWSDLFSSDSTLFSLAADNHPNDAVKVSRQGVVALLAWALPSVIDPNYTLGLLLSSTSGVASNTYYPDTQYNTKGMAALNPFGPQQMTFNVPDAVPFQLRTFYKNFDVANRTLTSAQMWGLWWPTGALSPF